MLFIAPLVVSRFFTAPPSRRSEVAIKATGGGWPGAKYLKVSEVGPDVVRLWYGPSPSFNRPASQALASFTPQPGLLKVAKKGRLYSIRSGGLLVLVDSNSLSATIEDAKTKRIIIKKLSPEPLSGVANSGLNPKQENEQPWSVTESLGPTDHLFGLGQDNQNGAKLDRRGTIRDLWAGQIIKSGNVTAQYPIPFMLAENMRGQSYGVFIDDVHRLRYDLGVTDPNSIRIDATGGEADFYVIGGPDPKQVLSRYTGLTGRIPRPALWSLGYIQSRCVFYNWHDVDGAYQGLTSRGYPVDCIVIDYNWPEVLNDFIWDKRWTVNGVPPGQRVGDYRAKGVKIVMSVSGPMMVDNSPTFAAGWAAGAFAKGPDGKPVKAGYYHGDLMDVTSPALDKWLYPQVKPREDEGVAGWWLDLTEPEGEEPDTVYKGGSSADIHNQYSLLTTKSFEKYQLKDHPNLRPFELTRTGSAGIQRYHSVLWSGDVTSDYATLAAHPSQMIDSALSGINGWTSDTGGFLSGFYKNDQFGAHARLYDRWMQFSVFSPVTRAHKAGLCMPYEFGPQTEADTLKYLKLRYRLLPYIYSEDVVASQTGIPLIRSMGLEFPRDPGSISAPGDEYMFGQNLLVAPVLGEDQTRRPVYFPPGRWVDWDTGKVYIGGKTITVEAPQSRIPVAVRPGAIIPMAPFAANTKVGKWDPLEVDIFPSGVSSFTMTQDDGRTFDYKRGLSTSTTFTCGATPGSVRFSIAESNRKFVPQRYVLKFHLRSAPKPATGQSWNPKTKVLTVVVAEAGKKNHSVWIQLTL